MTKEENNTAEELYSLEEDNCIMEIKDLLRRFYAGEIQLKYYIEHRQYTGYEDWIGTATGETGIISNYVNEFEDWYVGPTKQDVCIYPMDRAGVFVKETYSYPDPQSIYHVDTIKFGKIQIQKDFHQGEIQIGTTIHGYNEGGHEVFYLRWEGNGYYMGISQEDIIWVSLGNTIQFIQNNRVIAELKQDYQYVGKKEAEDVWQLSLIGEKEHLKEMISSFLALQFAPNPYLAAAKKLVNVQIFYGDRLNDCYRHKVFWSSGEIRYSNTISSIMQMRERCYPEGFFVEKIRTLTEKENTRIEEALQGILGRFKRWQIKQEEIGVGAPCSTLICEYANGERHIYETAHEPIGAFYRVADILSRFCTFEKDTINL